MDVVGLIFMIYGQIKYNIRYNWTIKIYLIRERIENEKK